MGSTRTAGWTELRALAVALALAGVACSGGGGGGGSGAGGGGGSGGSGGGPSPSGSTVSLAWQPAPGPVAGYAVYVQRNGGPYVRERDVSKATVDLAGEVGDRARIAVAAFTSSGFLGPASPPSNFFIFPDPNVKAPEAARVASAPSARVSALPAPGAGPSEPAPAEPDPDSEEPSALAPADLAAGLVWLADGALRVTNAAIETLLLLPAPSGAELVGSGDFDGDGAPELLWAEGETLSTMPLLGPEAGQRLGFGLLEPGERVAGVGDLDGDGLADLVLAASDGSVRSWLGAASLPSPPLGQADPSALAGVADFDGDGADDLVWRGADGAWSLWLMDGARVHAALALALGADLAPAAAGDFDGDGEAELALRDASGALYLAEPLDEAISAAGAADAGAWRPLGAADLDGDGRDDLVLIGDAALLVALLPGEREIAFDPASPWQPVALLH